MGTIGPLEGGIIVGEIANLTNVPHRNETGNCKPWQEAKSLARDTSCSPART
jgi:hypothetical protein